MATDFDSYYPFDSGNGSNVTEAEWSKMIRIHSPSGVIAQKDNELEVYGDSSGMQVKVKTGAFFILGHYGEITSEKTIAIDTADPSNPRIDLIVVKLDWTNNKIQLDVVKGTPASSPVEPSLTQSSTVWELAIAKVAVGAGVSTITSGNVTDYRIFSGKRILPYGFVIGSGSSAISATKAIILPPLPKVKLKLIGWQAVADQSGSIQIDIWADKYSNFPPVDGDSICGGNEIALSSAQKGEDFTLTSWTVDLPGNESDNYILKAYVDSCATIQQISVTLFFEEYE